MGFFMSLHLVCVSTQIKLIILPHLIKHCIESNLLPKDLPQISTAEKFAYVSSKLILGSNSVCLPGNVVFFLLFLHPEIKVPN